MGTHPQSLKILMFDSGLVLWRKGEIDFGNIEKIMKFNANNQLKLKKVITYLLYNGSTSLL